jgi:hypothetical protein
MGDLKPKMAESIRKIRHTFMHDWNPIGVDDLPEDEYDSYVMPVYSLLRQQRGESALTSYLAQVYDRIRGERLPADTFRDAAQKFLQIDVSQDEIHR